ncbi:pyruvate decarboxylase [Atractiella rhizophila]|nr:pyruvate decarboxylase [Atractiella rhizophila]
MASEYVKNGKIKLGYYILARLEQLGITKIFGVPGDFNLGWLDFIEDHKTIDWVGCCKSVFMNASYAADGFARIKQVQQVRVLCTTFGVGELSCVNGVAGAFSEHIPMLHIVGVPASHLQERHAILHHTLGDGRFDAYQKVAEHVTSYQAYITKPESAGVQVDKAIKHALKTARPTYLTLPTDLVQKWVNASPLSEPLFKGIPSNDILWAGALTSDPFLPSGTSISSDEQSFVVRRIEKMWAAAKDPVILVDACAIRFGVVHLVRDLIRKTGVRWFSSPMGKTGVSETEEGFAGVYSTHSDFSSSMSMQLQRADLIITIGTIKSDFNSGAFSWKFPTEQVVELHSDHVLIQYGRYENVSFHSILPELTASLSHPSSAPPLPKAVQMEVEKYSSNSQIKQDTFWQTCGRFFKEDDVIIGETGTALFGLLDVKMPKNSTFVGQVLWGSIGWTGGATLGCLLAAQESPVPRRTVLFIGDGSFQLTVQEVSSMIRLGLKPIIVVLENKGYTIERFIHGKERKYNDVQPWKWQQLLQLFSPHEGQYRVLKASTMGELENIFFKDEEFARADKITLLEVDLDPLDCPRALLQQSAKSGETNKYEE